MDDRPTALIAALAFLILISRPWLEARRAPLSPLLLLAVILGPSVAGAIPTDLLAGTGPLAALGAGWLVLLAAESWDLGSLKRIGASRRVLLLSVPAVIIAGLTILWPATTTQATAGLIGFAAPVILLVCAAGALDADAVRDALFGAERPDARARLAPAIASLALGSALAGTAVASGVHRSLRVGASAIAWAAPIHVLATLLLGIALGLFFLGPLRVAQGRGPILTLLIALPLAGWGLARGFEMSPPALLFAAGVVLANDASRRDLIFTLLRELQRPFTFLIILLAGARIPVGLVSGALVSLLLAAAGYTLARPLAWRFAPRIGLSAAEALPMSPLAIVIALEVLDWGDAVPAVARLFPAVVAIAFVLSEGVWFLIRRSAGAVAREVRA